MTEMGEEEEEEEFSLDCWEEAARFCINIRRYAVVDEPVLFLGLFGGGTLEDNFARIASTFDLLADGRAPDGGGKIFGESVFVLPSSYFPSIWNGNLFRVCCTFTIYCLIST